MKLIIILFTIAFTACSTRVLYEQPRTDASPDAVNVNTATVADLERLPHIGRRTAEAIVEFRTENGPFRRLEHLMLIRGVSAARFDELRPLLRTE
jgi:competence ComEA-like helix-hairpin-helix protein